MWAPRGRGVGLLPQQRSGLALLHAPSMSLVGKSAQVLGGGAGSVLDSCSVTFKPLTWHNNILKILSSLQRGGTWATRFSLRLTASGRSFKQRWLRSNVLWGKSEGRLETGFKRKEASRSVRGSDYCPHLDNSLDSPRPLVKWCAGITETWTFISGGIRIWWKN